MDIRENAYSFMIRFYKNDKVYNAVKKLPEVIWHPGQKVWVVPIKYRKSVDAFFRKYYVLSMASAPMVVGTIPPLPELYIDIPLQRKPYAFQNPGIAYILKHERVIIGDKPGLGKTTQAIGANIATGATPTLIICPATLKLNWQAELMTVAGERAVILDERTEKTWHRYITQGVAKYAIVNFESLKKFFVANILTPKPGESLRLKHIVLNEHIDLFKTIIVDESHRCKEVKTMHSKITMGLCWKKRFIYAISGTPIINKTADLIAQLHIIQRIGDFGGEEYFKERYCKTDEFLPELNYKLRTTCFYQREKKDVLTDLPDKRRKIVLCEISTRKEYDAAARNLENYLRVWKERTDSQIRKSMAGEAMVLINICRNISARGKLNEVYDYIDELLQSKEKPVLFVHQREIAAAILTRYPAFVSVTGMDSMERRNTNVYSFQNDTACTGIVCSIKAAGVGLTLTASSNVGMVEWPWHPADAEQCEDRTHRIGQKNAVLAAYFLGKNTVDQRMYEIIQEKRKIAGEATGSIDITQEEIIDLLADSLFKESLLA